MDDDWQKLPGNRQIGVKTPNVQIKNQQKVNTRERNPFEANDYGPDDC